VPLESTAARCLASGRGVVSCSCYVEATHPIAPGQTGLSEPRWPPIEPRPRDQGSFNRGCALKAKPASHHLTHPPDLEPPKRGRRLASLLMARGIEQPGRPTDNQRRDRRPSRWAKGPFGRAPHASAPRTAPDTVMALLSSFPSPTQPPGAPSRRHLEAIGELRSALIMAAAHLGVS